MLDLASQQAVNLFDGKAGGFGDKRRFQSSGEHSSGNNQSFLPGPFFDPLLDALLATLESGSVHSSNADVFFLFALFEDGPQPFVGVDPFHFFHGHEQLLLILEIFRKFLADEFFPRFAGILHHRDQPARPDDELLALVEIVTDGPRLQAEDFPDLQFDAHIEVLAGACVQAMAGGLICIIRLFIDPMEHVLEVHELMGKRQIRGKEGADPRRQAAGPGAMTGR